MRDYGLTLFIFSLVPFCVWRPWIGIIVWYWFGLMNPHRLTWDFAFTMPFAVCIGAATLIGAIFAKDKRPIPWNRELVLMVILFCDFLFTTAFAWAPDEAWTQLGKVFKIILMTYVATIFIYGKDRVRVLLTTAALSIGFYGIRSALWIARGGSRVEGPEGTFLSGNTFMGLALNMVFPLLIMLAREEQKRWLRRTLYFTAAMTFVAIPFTYSRGAYLGMIVALPLLFFQSRQKVIAATILIPTVLIAPLVLPDTVFQRADQIENYEEDSSANMRLATWTLAWNLAKDRPLTGAGFEFEWTPDPDRWYHYLDEKYLKYFYDGRMSVAHSIYFQMLGQHGFPGLILFLTLMFGSLMSLQRTKKRAEKRADLKWLGSYASGVQIGLLCYLINGAFLNSAYFDLVWLFVASSAILARELKSAEAEIVSVSNQTAPPLSNPTAGVANT